MYSYQASAGHRDTDDTRDKVINKRGEYVINKGRARKISKSLSKGRNVLIFVDGNISFVKGVSICGNSNLTLKATSSIEAKHVCILVNTLNIESNAKLK